MNLPEEHPATAASKPHLSRIIAAITERDRILFLEHALPHSSFASEIEFASESDLSPANWARRLEFWRPEIMITGWSTPPLPESWLNRADCPLRYICHIVGSVRHLVPRSFIERGGLVTNWGERVSSQVAEHGLLLALAALRNQPSWSPFIDRPAAERQITELRTRTLFALRVGLHGFGSVARALVPLLRPFGVSLSAYSAGVPHELFNQHGVRPAASLQELFAGSDVLIECESLTAVTRGIVTAGLLAALPNDAVFVNIGRGEVVDEAALMREATAGRLRVALDVSAVEPLTVESPVVRCGRVILSPHIAGPTSDRYAECGTWALEKLERFLDGQPPDSVMSLATYDRAT